MMLHAQVGLSEQFNAVFGDSTQPKEHNVRITSSRSTNKVVIHDACGVNTAVALTDAKATTYFGEFDRLKKERSNLTIQSALNLLAQPYIQHWK